MNARKIFNTDSVANLNNLINMEEVYEVCNVKLHDALRTLPISVTDGLTESELLALYVWTKFKGTVSRGVVFDCNLSKSDMDSFRKRVCAKYLLDFNNTSFAACVLVLAESLQSLEGLSGEGNTTCNTETFEAVKSLVGNGAQFGSWQRGLEFVCHTYTSAGFDFDMSVKNNGCEETLAGFINSIRGFNKVNWTCPPCDLRTYILRGDNKSWIPIAERSVANIVNTSNEYLITDQLIGCIIKNIPQGFTCGKTALQHEVAFLCEKLKEYNVNNIVAKVLIKMCHIVLHTNGDCYLVDEDANIREVLLYISYYVSLPEFFKEYEVDQQLYRV